jgi:hypothetical protein
MGRSAGRRPRTPLKSASGPSPSGSNRFDASPPSRPSAARRRHVGVRCGQLRLHRRSIAVAVCSDVAVVADHWNRCPRTGAGRLDRRPPRRRCGGQCDRKVDGSGQDIRYVLVTW